MFKRTVKDLDFVLNKFIIYIKENNCVHIMIQIKLWEHSTFKWEKKNKI